MTDDERPSGWTPGARGDTADAEQGEGLKAVDCRIPAHPYPRGAGRPASCGLQYASGSRAGAYQPPGSPARTSASRPLASGQKLPTNAWMRSTTAACGSPLLVSMSIRNSTLNANSSGSSAASQKNAASRRMSASVRPPASHPARSRSARTPSTESDVVVVAASVVVDGRGLAEDSESAPSPLQAESATMATTRQSSQMRRTGRLTGGSSRTGESRRPRLLGGSADHEAGGNASQHSEPVLDPHQSPIHPHRGDDRR